MAWLTLSLGYVFALGIIGVTSKLALRSVTWQDLLLLTALAYAATAAILVLTGKAGISTSPNFGWAIGAAALMPIAAVFLYTALGLGDASKVVPVSAAYPAVTLVFAAIVLSERVTALKVGGLILVVGGVIALSITE